jgi:site-specific recombinase XerD
VTDQDHDLLEAWRFDVSGRVSGPIQREYRRYLDEFRREIGPLTTATTFQLRRFMIDRSDRWGPSTMQICRRAFRSFYGWAVGTGVVAENPALALPTIEEDLDAALALREKTLAPSDKARAPSDQARAPSDQTSREGRADARAAP